MPAAAAAAANKPASPQPARLIRYLDRQADELAKALPKLARRRAKAKPVHNARVAARRLGAALTLIEPLVGKRSVRGLRKSAKRIRKALGEVRDADVMIDQVDAERDHLSKRDRKQIVKELTDRRDRSMRDAKRKLKKCDAALDKSLRKAIEKCSPGVVAALRESLHAQLDALHDAVRAATQQGGSLHPARIAAKRLRYTVEIGIECKVAIPKAAVGQLRQLQEDLGAWHDAAVLARSIVRHTADETDFEAKTDEAVARVHYADRIVATGARAAQRFLKRWQQTGGKLEATLRHALPARRKRSGDG